MRRVRARGPGLDCILIVRDNDSSWRRRWQKVYIYWIDTGEPRIAITLHTYIERVSDWNHDWEVGRPNWEISFFFLFITSKQIPG